MRLWGMQLNFQVAGKDIPGDTKKPEQQRREETERKDTKKQNKNKKPKLYSVDGNHFFFGAGWSHQYTEAS